MTETRLDSIIDLIALLRPTLSTGLYVQMAGRGTRKAEGKANCLILDFAGNVMRHGPVDCVEVATDRPRGKSEPHAKVCPQCDSLVAVAARTCPDCGFAWPARPANHAATAGIVPVLSIDAAWTPVRSIGVRVHAKPDRPPLLCIDFETAEFGSVLDWLALDHGDKARWHAARKWRRLGGSEPVPRTAHEAYARRSELAFVTTIAVCREFGFWRVADLRLAREAA